MADNIVMLKRDGSNYSYWSHLMSQYMFNSRRELWDYVCGLITEPNPGHENYIKLSKDWKTSNAEIFELISQNVLNPSILKQFKSGKEVWDYLAELYGKSAFAKKYQLETRIRGTQQGDRTIQEFHGVMVGLWDQLAMLENKDLSTRSSYKENREEERLVQFLIALRDEFEPLRKSILCRRFLHSVEQVVSELAAEEMRLKPTIVSSKFSNLSLKTDQNFQMGKVGYGYGRQTGDLNDQTYTDGSVKAYGYSGGFDQSRKYSKPTSSQERSALSSSMPETDQPYFIGGLAKVAMASFAAVQVSRALYNYYTEPVESFSGTGTYSKTLKILSYNVWFREDLEMHKRMRALGDLVQLHSPDLICFQEVTANIYNIFQQSSWWKLYRCSVSNEKA